MINPWPLAKKQSRQSNDLNKINSLYLQQIIPLYDRRTQQPNDLQLIMEECNDMFLRKKKQMHSIALFVVYYHQELQTFVASQFFMKDVQECYLNAFNEDKELEEALAFY